MIRHAQVVRQAAALLLICALTVSGTVQSLLDHDLFSEAPGLTDADGPPDGATHDHRLCALWQASGMLPAPAAAPTEPTTFTRPAGRMFESGLHLVFSHATAYPRAPPHA